MSARGGAWPGEGRAPAGRCVLLDRQEARGAAGGQPRAWRFASASIALFRVFRAVRPRSCHGAAMNMTPRKPMTLRQFLAWEERQELPGQAPESRLRPVSTTCLRCSKQVVDTGLRRHDGGSGPSVNASATWYYKSSMVAMRDFTSSNRDCGTRSMKAAPRTQPIEAFQLLDHDEAACCRADQCDPRAPRSLGARDWTRNKHSGGGIEVGSCQDQRRSILGLFARRLRIEIDPGQITLVRQIGHYQTSRPTRSPQPTSPGRLSGVKPSSSSAMV